MAKPFLNVTPGYPLRHRELFRTLVAKSRSEREVRLARWAYGRKEWNLEWPSAFRTTETEPVRDMYNQVDGDCKSFYWKEPNQTSRNRVYIGIGDGTTTDWLMPCQGWSALTVRVNSTTQTSGTNFTLSYSGGDNGMDLIQFASAVTSGYYIDCDYTNGNLIPLVRFSGGLSISHKAPGEDYANISVTIRETKEQ